MRMTGKTGLVGTVVGVTCIFMLVCVVFVATSVTHVVRREMEQAETANLRNGMRAAVAILERDLPGVHVAWGPNGTVGRITADVLPARFSSHSMVDAVGDVVAGGTTLFVLDEAGHDFIRRTTNIRGRDGKRVIDTPLDPAGAPFRAMMRGEAFEGVAQVLGVPYYTLYQPIFSSQGNRIIGVDSVAIVATRVDAVTDNLIWTIVWVAGAMLVLSAVLMSVVTVRLMRPLPVMTRAMKALARGEVDAPIPFAGRADEIGAMAKAVEVFRVAAIDNARLEAETAASRKAEITRLERQAKADEEARERVRVVTSGLADALSRVAGGDLSIRIEKAFSEEFEILRNDFNRSVEQLAGTFASVSTTVDAIDNGTRELASGADNLASRTEHQAASLEQTAAAVAGIVESVRVVAQRSEEARKIGAQARESASLSVTITGETEEAMGRIESGSKEMASIVDVIDNIAFQTNVLALNASVEAARAGESGRGFAVVATEVRALAQRSADAAKEIRTLIRRSAEDVREGASRVHSSGNALRTVTTFIGEISQHLDAIAMATKEQSSSLSEVNVAVGSLDQTTQQNAAVSEEFNAASRSVAGETTRLAALVRQFRLPANGKGHRVSRRAPLALA